MQVTATEHPSIFNYQTITRVRREPSSAGAPSLHPALSHSPEMISPRRSDSNLDQKMADLSRIQSAFIAALRNGQSLSQHFEPIL